MHDLITLNLAHLGELVEMKKRVTGSSQRRFLNSVPIHLLQTSSTSASYTQNPKSILPLLAGREKKIYT